MMSINKHRRNLNECRSEEEPDSADHLSPRMFESPKARSDDQILRRRHSLTETDRRRSIEFERQDFIEEIRHRSNLRQQSREQTRRDGVTVRSPTLVKNNTNGQPSVSQENGTFDEYGDDQSQHSDQDVRSTSRSSSLLQLPESFQSAHRTGHLVTDLQGVVKPRSLNFIDESSRYNRLNEGVMRAYGDQRERTTVPQEQRSWSTVDTDIHVQRDNVKVVRPSVLSEPQHTAERNIDQRMESFRVALKERQRQNWESESRIRGDKSPPRNDYERQAFETCPPDLPSRNIIFNGPSKAMEHRDELPKT